MSEKFIQVNITRILSANNNNNTLYLALSNNIEEKILEVEHYESAMLAFHYDDFADYSHIKTIYQIFISFLKSSNYIIEKCEIDNYSDGIGYCKITLAKNKKRIYFYCSISDGIILALIEKIPLLCSKKAWEELDSISDEYLNLEE